MARIISTCGTCGFKMIRDYFEASLARVPFGMPPQTKRRVWVSAESGDIVCLGYEQGGCGMCRSHPQGHPHFACPTCGGPMRHTFTTKEVKVTHSDRVKCGAKCHTATSDTCTCECDGANHGSALRIAIGVLL